MKIWRDHSLSIVLASLSFVFLTAALLHSRDSMGWDIWLGLFHACISVALLNFLAGPFRERNRPED